MTDQVRISVIVPVYNAADLLPRTVGSILMQEFEAFEVILVNDGSTDGSAAVCDDLAVQDDRISVIHKDNGGGSSARNAGLDAARGGARYGFLGGAVRLGVLMHVIALGIIVKIRRKDLLARIGVRFLLPILIRLFNGILGLCVFLGHGIV